MIVVLVMACATGTPPAAEVDPVEPQPMPIAPPTAEQHARNLRFRDNRAVFNESAAWLDAHRDEALPVMGQLLADEGPAAIGVARVLGAMDDARVVPLLEPALASSNDELAFEAARALAKTSGPAAEAALRRAGASEQPGVVKNALRGIELRGDPALCEVAQVHRDAAEPVGTYARRAIEKLGC